VIPAFREAGRIAAYVNDLASKIISQSLPISVTVVDDGSGEAEVEETRLALEPSFRHKPSILKIIALPENTGKGGAIKAGWNDLEPSCTFVAFADADGSVSARETIRFLKIALASNGSTTYFASRIKMLGREIYRSNLRHLTGRVFATVVSLTTRVPVYDSQCGCKVVPRAAYESLKHVLEENRFAFDVELMTALIRSRNVIEEIPVDWHDVSGSKVSILRDSIRMFISCLKIRIRSRNWTFPSKGKL